MNDEELYLDQSLINDFFAEYEDAQVEINNAIEQLMIEVRQEFVDSIFRRVHSVKSNLRMIGEKQQSDIIHYLEDILACAKKNTFKDIIPLLYLVRVIIEEVRFLTKKQFQDGIGAEMLGGLKNDLEVLSGLPESDLPKNLRGFLATIELQGDYDVNFSLQDLSAANSTASYDQNDTPKNDINGRIEQLVTENADLVFFKELIEQLEAFMPFWQDRSKKILQLLIDMNRVRNFLVDEQQLIAAAYMHDIGMGFIAPFITHKPFALEADEEIIMQDHIHHGSEILKRIPGWEVAARMVAEHHESIDGSGYPLGLTGANICEGAKLLAIGDAYWAMTNDRMHVYRKKPAVNALMDINKKSGLIYDEQWVTAFNEVLNNS